MSYTITPSQDGKYIILKGKGGINRKEAIKQDLEAHELGGKLGINCYLVNMTEARNNDPLIDKYDFAYSDMQETQGIDRQARVATVVAEGDHSHDFIETVSRNSGLDVKLFKDIEKAKSYLLEKN